ncbi:hypothetical protein GGC63_004420 [Paenibacillus sp. OAS669]|nr:hypothetical protein [Paenibacillus sp. OAS669]
MSRSNVREPMPVEIGYSMLTKEALEDRTERRGVSPAGLPVTEEAPGCLRALVSGLLCNQYRWYHGSLAFRP